MLSIESVDLLADGLDHPECVAVHPDGSIWAGGEAGQVYKISPQGKVNIVCNTGGFVLGIAFSPDASWLAICDNKHQCVWKYEIAVNRLSLLAAEVEGMSISIPNYPVFDDDGNLYVSDSGAFRSVTGRIYKFHKAGPGIVWHPGHFSFTNGMALSGDRKYLYVVCTWLPGVERIAINEDGSAGDREVYITMPKTCPDGIAFDEAGNLYVCCYTPNRIYKVNSDKELSILLDDWEAHTICNPTNIAFGGDDFRDLYIAGLGRWHVSKVRLEEKGLKLACHH